MNEYFGSTYSDARGRFLSACVSRNVEVARFVNHHRGPQGEGLYTDVALIGSVDAERILVIQSATHGAEGFCGSGIQVGLLTAEYARLETRAKVATLLVHAINPYGFAWLRRTNEDNIDLNRHFVDLAGPLPENALYAEIADALVPRMLDEDSVRESERRIRAFYERHGEWRARQAERGGQATHPQGLHYRGTQPCWSRRTVEAICGRYLRRARYAALIDIHTGLGPYGYGEPLTTSASGSAAERRCRAWYGDEIRSTVSPAAGYSGGRGSMIDGYALAAPGVEWTSIGLEFGTLPSEQVIRAERADAWLHCYGDPQSEAGRRIKADVRAALYPDADDWRLSVWKRGLEITSRALDGLDLL